MDKMDLEKYRQAILYFLHECHNEHLGKTKLFKLLYYLDFDHFQFAGSSVTGDTYIKMQHGPFPVAGEGMLGLLMEEGTILHEPQVKYTFQQDSYIPQVPYDLTVFTESEVVTLTSVADRWRDSSKKEIEDASHEDGPWERIPMRKAIPYELASQRQPTPVRAVTDVQPEPTVFTPQEREAVIRSVMGSQELEGLYLSRSEVEGLLDEVLKEPLVKLGSE